MNIYHKLVRYHRLFHYKHFGLLNICMQSSLIAFRARAFCKVIVFIVSFYSLSYCLRQLFAYTSYNSQCYSKLYITMANYIRIKLVSQYIEPLICSSLLQYMVSDTGACRYHYE